MKVYRYLGECELNKILNGDLENLGRKFSRSKCSTHKYNPNKKYLHFFKLKTAIQEIQRLRRYNDEQQYICEFDIPMVVLMLGMGTGFYNPHGYDCDVSRYQEFRVSTDVFKPKWLKKYTRVEKLHILKDGVENSGC